MLKTEVATKDPGDPTRPYVPGFNFNLEAKWIDTSGSDVDVTSEWFIQDTVPAAARRLPFRCHVVLAYDEGAGITLIVNGQTVGTVACPGLSKPFSFKLAAEKLDGIRLYSRVVDAAEADGHYRNHESLARQGLYTSPSYTFDEPTALELAQWTGLFPSALLDVVGDPVPRKQIMSVAVIGYAGPDGTGASRPVHLPGSGETVDLRQALAGLGPVRSFRYMVAFDCSDVAGVLDDLPVFESVWFTFKRPHRLKGWTAWE